MISMGEWIKIRELLAVGQEVTFSSESPIYEGPYTSSILELLDDGMRIGMPLEAGRLVLIPVGTTVNLAIPGDDRRINLDVVDRRGGNERSLLLRIDRSEVEHEQMPMPPAAPVFAVTSGKGGVGKSTFVINLSLALVEMGKRPCIIDADLGTANIDVLLNLTPPFNLGDVVNGSRHMVEVLVEGPQGVLVLPGGSGLKELTSLHDDEFAELITQFQRLDQYADVILIDTGSGVASDVTNFVAASVAGIMLSTPEPHAITDGYALLKVLTDQDKRVPMHLVINRAHSASEAELAVHRMTYAARRFLQYELSPLGYIREDASISRAVRQQVPWLTQYPRSKSASDLRLVAEKLVEVVGLLDEDADASGTPGFLRRLRALFPMGARDKHRGA